MEIDRREFSKLIAGVGGALSYSKLLGRDSSKCGELSAFDDVIAWSSDKIAYWVDGFNYRDTELNNRAYMAILIKHVQNQEEYIDKIVCTNKDKEIILAQYFAPEDRISSGYLPYILLSNIDLSQSLLFLYIQVRSPTQLRRYRYTFSNLERSKLTGPQLPAELVADMRTAAHAGIVSSPFFLPDNDSGLSHNVRARLLDVKPSGFFSVGVEFMHGDQDLKHYMRYFIVTDPVGRILGLSKRLGPKGYDKVKLVLSLSEQERNTWGMTRNMVAKIGDCPYIMVFCDDIAESLSKTTIWLR